MATGGAAGALRRFELDGVHDTGREVGHGSYAVVKELASNEYIIIHNHFPHSTVHSLLIT